MSRMGRPSLVRVLIRRAFQAATASVLVGIVGFGMMRALPGDVAMRIAAARYGYEAVSAAAADAVRTELGLDRPALSVLTRWLLDVARLDLGTSWVSGAPVTQEIGHQLGQSLLLASAALAFSLLLGPVLGVMAARRPGGMLDSMTSGMAVLTKAAPPFLVGLVLILIFSVRLGAFPAAGDAQPSSVVLPAVTLALGLTAGSSRVTREAVAAVGRSTYFAFAHTKGLSTVDALVRHGLRNAAIPVIAYLGVQVAFLVEGVVAVETLFAWPGIGHALVHAIFGRDVPMIQGTALVLTLAFVALNTVVDLLCAVVDPRR